MIRKIHTYLLITLFSISIIGVPLTQHFCRMMDENSVEKYSMCVTESEPKAISCCEEEFGKKKYQFNIQDYQCCNSSFELIKIDENFYPTVSTKVINQYILVDYITPVDLVAVNQSTNSYFNAYDLPPPKFGKQLLTSLHQLKLDIPIC